MRRYPMLFILLLSFVMPLQAAADVLLSGLVCPMLLENAQASTAINSSAQKYAHIEHEEMEHAEMEHAQMEHAQTAHAHTSHAQPSQHQHTDTEMPHMKCCPPAHHTQADSAIQDKPTQTAQDCPQMKCCHLCKTSTQAFVYVTPSFITPRVVTFVASTNSAFVASFNPNAVWRPPINT